MAEVAGLVLGVVGIGGLIGAFKDTVEVFNLVADSRHLGREYEILETKLDIEKTILLMWANRVRLLSPDYDRRLDDPDIQKLVIRMLECIASLFEDVPEITTRYGLDGSRTLNSIHGDSDLVPRTLRISEPRWQDFLANYTKLRASKDGKRLPAPFFKRARWVIRDKTKFKTLIDELAHFTAKINEVVPVVMDDSYMRMLSDKDVSSIRDLRKLKILEEASVGSGSTITASAQYAIAEAYKDRILNKLWFRKIDDRRESIRAAHGSTLKWALSPSTSDVPWDDLSEWLQSGSGIYWISGKAGSGKSTLMKHLYMDKRIHKFLSQWAGGERYTLCDFFFMNLGTTEQKSQEGLSRTLLYQILSTNRDLIPETLPYMWKEIHDQKQNSTEDNISLPSNAEIAQAFDVIARSCDIIGRFCFLIDGMDEFVGNYTEGIAFIKSLACNEHIKIIVSSRPIPSCVAAFTTSPKLRLQDLSRDDIASYVHDIIGRHEYMVSLVRQSADKGQMLMQDIVDKSAGVFLWVVLACRSLLSGFDDHDSMSELQRRVDELPPELENLFQHMLNRINKRHQEDGSRLLRVCYMHQTSRWVPTGPLLTLGLAMVADYTTTAFHDGLYRDKEDYMKKEQDCKSLEGRLRSRCGGLLEIANGNTYCLCQGLYGKHNRHIDSQVVFMHRTVFEFLNNENTWELECLQLPPNDNFDAATALSLCGLHIALESLHPSIETEQASIFFWEGLNWAVFADELPRGDSRLFFDSLGTLEHYCRSSSTVPERSSFHKLMSLIAVHPEYSPLLVAIQAGAVNYVRGSPHLRPILLHDKYDRTSCKCLPVLHHALLGTFISNDIEETLPSRNLIKTLLDSGFNPNMPVEISAWPTPWSVWLRVQEDIFPNSKNSGKMKFLLLVEDLLLAGADPDIDNGRLLAIVSQNLNNMSTSEQVREKIRQIILLAQKLKAQSPKSSPATPEPVAQFNSTLAPVMELQSHMEWYLQGI